MAEDTGPDTEGADPDLAPVPRRRHNIEEFEASYLGGTPPWDIGRPQAVFAHLVESGAIRGRVLDVGCGTGEHALLAAAGGLEVTGIDAAPAAIRAARDKAAQRSVVVRFEVWDALELPALGVEFDTVLDCGLFHVFDDDDRARFVTSLSGAVARGGRYVMLCFSDKQSGDWGPRRVSEDELRESFADGWRVDSIDDAELETTLGPEGARAWLAVFTRT